MAGAYSIYFKSRKGGTWIQVVVKKIMKMNSIGLEIWHISF